MGGSKWGKTVRSPAFRVQRERESRTSESRKQQNRNPGGSNIRGSEDPKTKIAEHQKAASIFRTVIRNNDYKERNSKSGIQYSRDLFGFSSFIGMYRKRTATRGGVAGFLK
jgi:hypothetical protein